MLRVPVASLLAHRLRLILTATTIVIGVAFVAGTFILTDSIQRALSVPASAASEVVVQPASAAGKGAAIATVPARLVSRIRAVPGVAAADGSILADKVVMIGRDDRPVDHIRAVNELRSYPASRALAAQFTLQSGRPPTGSRQALVDAATAHRLGYRVGDRIGVITPKGTQVRLTVTGVTGFDGADSPAAEQIQSFDTPTVLVVTTATAQRLAGLPGQFTEIDAEAAPGISAAVLRDRIARVLPAQFAELTGQQAFEQQVSPAAQTLAGLRTDLLAFCAMALLVAAFVIAITFTILAAQRTREHALMRVIGASRGQLLRSVLAEATLLGLTSSAAGAGLGVLAAFGLRGIIGLLGGTLPPGGVVIAPRTVLAALAVGTIVTVVSALGPARRAARVAPIRALRQAPVEPARQSRLRLAAGLAALGLAAALMTTGVVSHNTLLIGAGAVIALTAVLLAGPFLAGPAAHLVTGPAIRLFERSGQEAGTAQPGHSVGPRRRIRAGWYTRRGAVPARLARDNAAGNPRRTAASAAVLVVGVSIAAAISVIAASARASAQDAVGGSHADLYLQGSGITARLSREVAAQPGVFAVTPLADPLVDVGGNRTRVVGIDPASVPYLINLGVRSGDLSTLHGQRLFVFAGQAAAHGWAIGSHVTVDFGQGPRTLTVAGTFSDRRFLGDDYLMGIDTLFRDMPDQQSQAAALLVRAARRTSALALKSTITPLLTATPGVSVQTAAQYARAQAADLGDTSHVLGLLTALAVLTDLIAILGIASTLTLSLTERTRELGVVRALGLTRRQLTEMIAIESVITCLIGALPGTVLGLACGAALSAVLTSNQTGVATVRLPPGQLLTLLALACVTGLFASIVPAACVARLPILQASTD